MVSSNSKQFVTVNVAALANTSTSTRAILFKGDLIYCQLLTIKWVYTWHTYYVQKCMQWQIWHFCWNLATQFDNPGGFGNCDECGEILSNIFTKLVRISSIHRKWPCQWIWHFWQIWQNFVKLLNDCSLAKHNVGSQPCWWIWRFWQMWQNYLAKHMEASHVSWPMSLAILVNVTNLAKFCQITKWMPFMV